MQAYRIERPLHRGIRPREHDLRPPV